jgi:hypothetical protein
MQMALSGEEKDEREALAMRRNRLKSERMIDRGTVTPLRWKPVYPICNLPVEFPDMHEAILTRGDVAHANPLDVRPMAYVRENCVLVHPGKCHLTAATKVWQVKCIRRLIEHEGLGRILAWLCEIEEHFSGSQVMDAKRAVENSNRKNQCLEISCSEQLQPLEFGRVVMAMCQLSILDCQMTYPGIQVSHMLISAMGDRNEALYHLPATTGMRQSERLGLRWSDLDWEGCSLQIQRQLKLTNSAHYYYEPPKTKAGRRTVVLGKKTIEKLREHHERQQLERIQAGQKWVEKDLIFPSSIGTPMDQANLLKEFKQLIKAAGLPEIRFHDLRHSAASLMLNHGIPVIVVSRRLGHSKPSVTLDVYGHLMPGMQNEAADLMDELGTPVNFALHPVAPQEKSPLIE